MKPDTQMQPLPAQCTANASSGPSGGPPDMPVCRSPCRRRDFLFLAVHPSYHTTHTTKAERRAEESHWRQRRQRVANRPTVASKDKTRPLPVSKVFFLESQAPCLIMEPDTQMQPLAPRKLLRQDRPGDHPTCRYDAITIIFFSMPPPSFF